MPSREKAPSPEQKQPQITSKDILILDSLIQVSKPQRTITKTILAYIRREKPKTIQEQIDSVLLYEDTRKSADELIDGDTSESTQNLLDTLSQILDAASEDDKIDYFRSKFNMLTSKGPVWQRRQDQSNGISPGSYLINTGASFISDILGASDVELAVYVKGAAIRQNDEMAIATQRALHAKDPVFLLDPAR
jgi:hypothetical protein